MVDFFMVNVGKYTSPMDAMGYDTNLNNALFFFSGGKRDMPIISLDFLIHLHCL